MRITTDGKRFICQLMKNYRIFIVGPQWMGEWTEGMGRAAADLGHEAALFFYSRSDYSTRLRHMTTRRLHPTLLRLLRSAANRLERSRDVLQNVLMNRRLIAAARAFQPTVIIVLKGEVVSRDALVALREQKISLVSWWVDDPFYYPISLLRHFELFDTVYVYDKESVAKLKARGTGHASYLPCACDQTTFYPQKLAPSDYPDLNCTIGFVATHYPGRAELLSRMKGLDIGLWGGGWWEAAHQLRELPDGYWRGHRLTPADAARVYNLARICPNVHHPQTKLGGLNTRTFEIPAAGGFELVDNVPGLEEHFDIGREIVAYSDPANFRELTDYYLSHPAERSAIVERGHDRVLRDHTYKQRLETILKNAENYA